MEAQAVGRGRRAAAIGLLAAGAALRIWQFAGGAALWVDEIALAENVLARPLSRLLFEPLGFDQVAPPGFLAAEKAASLLFGPGERSLRLVPLLASLAALALFARLAFRVLAGWTAVFALGLFAGGVPLVLYAAEAKPYSLDVAAAAGLTLLALRLAERPGDARREAAAGLAGILAVGFSHASVLFLAGLGAALAVRMWPRRGRGLSALPLATLALWAAGAAAAGFAARRTVTPAMRDFLQRFWDHAFWPAPATAADALWLPRTLRGFWGQSLFQYPASVAYLAVMLVGFWALRRRRRDAAMLLLGPVLAMLLASALRLYPFYGRLLLPLAPAFLLALSEGAGFLAARLRLAPALAAGLLAVAPLAALAANRPVHPHEEVRPLLGWIAANRRPGDAVYVSHGAERALRFYGPRFGLPPEALTFGGCHRDDRRAYLRELDAFRGRDRVWAIFVHDVTSVGEQAAAFAYLDAIGVRRARREVVESTGSPMVAALYDLSLPGRLASSSAGAFPLPEGDAALARRLGCGSGPLRSAAR